jgi:uncharacterized protein
MREYNEIFEFVASKLEAAENQCGKAKATINYSRFLHIERVYAWVIRILSELSADITIHAEILKVAAIFHDVGYGITEGNDQHSEAGAIICEEYLRGKEYDSQFIKEVVYLVRNHSRKELLTDRNTPIELIVLMEADLMDDTAALGLVMDTMIVTKKRQPDFMKIYNHMLNYSVKEMKANPMVTEPSKRFWKEKQRLTEDFIHQLARDLNIEK